MTSVTVLRRVGRYEILREVGRGGTAVVYLARQTDLDRSVALKELAAFRAADPAFVERFLRESQLTGSLNHPNIVTVYEYFEHDGTAFIAMEYFERGSLRPLVGELSLAQVVGVLEGLFAGLAHAEKHGIVHRDLKPENVMVTSAGGVKIADFGMAKARELQAGRELTASGTTVGTPAYMAPEQAMGQGVGPGTDLYSVGVIAYEMLTGAVPFDQAEVPMAIMLRHLNDEIPPLRSVKPDLDPQLAGWVERLLAKEPVDRPKGAAEAWEELEEIAIGSLGPRWRRQSRLTGTHALADVAPIAQPTSVTEELRTTRKFPRRLGRVWVAGLLAALALGAAGIIAAVELSGSDETNTAGTQQITKTSDRTTSPPEPEPVVGPVLASMKVDENADPVTATLRLSGPGLDRGSVLVRDSDITDGHVWFVLRQTGIGARTSGVRNDPLSVRVRKGKNLLRVDLAVTRGTFDRFQVRRVDGHTVVATLTKATVTAPPSGSTPTGTVTEPTDTTPTTKPPPTKPPIKTG